MPLLTTRDGRKMGKSAQGAVWLNEERLSAFDFWQFWRNCDDADVERFLALFTELPLDEVRRLAALGGAEINLAKTVLANEATRLAHGEQAQRAAEAAAAEVFADRDGGGRLPTLALSRQQLEAGVSLVELLVQTGVQPSRSAVRRLAEGGGLRLDEQPVPDPDVRLTAGDVGRRVSLGKKRHLRITAVD